MIQLVSHQDNLLSKMTRSGCLCEIQLPTWRLLNFFHNLNAWSWNTNSHLVHFILIFKTTQHSGKEWGSLCSELAKWGWQPAESAEWLLKKKSCKLTECWHSFDGGITIYNLPRSSTVTGSFSASKLSWKSVMWECRVHNNKIPEYIHEYIHCLRSFMLSNAS